MSDTSDTPTVTFATLSAGHPHIEHMRSCQSVMGRHSLPGFEVIAVTSGTSGPYLDIGRNQLVARLLDDPLTAASDWFVFLDDDIAFTPEQATALLNGAIAQDTRIASGPYWCMDPNFGASICAYQLTAFDEATHPEACRWSVQPDGRFLRVLGFDELASDPLPVTSFGAGFMAVHRTLLLEMRGQFGHPQEWFAEMVIPSGHPDVVGGLWLGEDHMFCLRAGVMDEQPYLVPGARGIIHYKTVGMVVPEPQPSSDPAQHAALGGYRLPGE